ncbi:MAG: 50S ribosomal protein L23 [Bdellovibrionales bacterium]|jgi:large subunit ribosomal protein L23|nr:50S ribosomal protein L23 [Bdellovibrionales bacterium]
MSHIIKAPLISEKNAAHAEDANTYAFEVALDASKPEIQKAIETSFNVKVESVRTLICRGKYFRKQIKLGAPKHWKKALVKLKAGEKISIFEGA